MNEWIETVETVSKDYEELVTDLRRAYRKARKHKAGTGSCIRCSMELEDELDELATTILDGSYAMRPSICFLVSSPVIREVIAADFRDRIVHHYLFDYLNIQLERELIEDCYSCRDGKGTGYGVDRLEHHIRSCSQNYTRECWVLQLDISGYFMSINRWRLYTMAMELMVRIGRQRDKKDRLLKDLPKHRIVEQLLAKVILYNPLDNCEIRDLQNLYPLLPRTKSLRYAPPGIGLPIGNLTSQMFSNLYMNGFDQWVKRSLKVKHYGRYVDDTFYVSRDREWLLSLVPDIEERLESYYGLHLNIAKTKLTEARKGVSFLGIHLKPYRRYVKGKTLTRMRRQARDMENISLSELSNEHVRMRLLAQANSMLGVLNHTRSFLLRKSLFGHYPLYTFACGTEGMRKFEMLGKPNDIVKTNVRHQLRMCTKGLTLCALLLAACQGGQQQNEEMTAELAQLDRRLTVGMQVDGEPVLHVIDSLETAGRLPHAAADYERGTCYALMEQRRLGEYYYKKALESDELFRLMPDAYFRSATNLAILLSGKNDEQGALTVATRAFDRMQQLPGASVNSRWAAALLFNIGSSQLRLGHQTEGLGTLEHSLSQIEQLVQIDASTENIRTWATLAVNSATVVAEAVPEEALNWITRADETMRHVPLVKEIPAAFFDMLYAKIASLMAIYFITHDQPGEAERAFQRYLSTDYSKAPASLVEQLTYLEKAGRWQEAARLLPDIWKLHQEMDMEKDIDYLSALAEGVTVYRHAGDDHEALKVADRLASLVDSVKIRQREDMAAELAVIYETQQKEQQIYRQQWQMRRQQGATVAILLVLVVAFLLVYIFFRRRAAQRLKAANDRLNEANTQLNAANDQLHQRNEELLVANERAEESSRMKTKFIQQISHEIRTPLNILSGFTQVVTTPGIELGDEEKADISQRITENTDRITQLVNKMLELSDASSQTVIPKDDVVSVEEIAAQAVDESGIRMARHLDFTMSLEAGTADLWIKTNLRYAVRALAQLLDNAKKFTHPALEGDNLQDYAPEKKETARLTVRRHDSAIEFIVEDSGPGVPPEQAEHIFEEFVQLNEFYEGTGIGLSVARSIARRLGGDIQLSHNGDSPHCEKTRFVMTLPIS